MAGIPPRGCRRFSFPEFGHNAGFPFPRKAVPTSAIITSPPGTLLQADFEEINNMQTIDIVTLNTEDDLEIQTIPLDHMPFMVEKKPSEIICPRPLLPLFRAARRAMPVALVSCRVIGLREQADGSHIRHYIATQESADKIRPLSLTI
jgi:hypothetical protein